MTTSYLLPPRALALIKEYSKPLTRPDWRTLQLMTFDNFYHSLRLSWRQTKKLYNPEFTYEQIEHIRKLLLLFNKVSINAINGYYISDIYRDYFNLSKEEICIKYGINMKILNVILSYT